jgi:hypothetical protein
MIVGQHLMPRLHRDLGPQIYFMTASGCHDSVSLYWYLAFFAISTSLVFFVTLKRLSVSVIFAQRAVFQGLMADVVRPFRLRNH